MNPSAAQRRKTLWITARTIFFGSLFLALWAWIALQFHHFDALLKISFPAWTVVPGAILMTLGAAVILYCTIFFVTQGRGTPAPFDPPRQLVAEGPYKFCRNPIYIGFFLLLGGLGLCWRSPSVLLLAVIAILGTNILIIVWEEPILRKKYGPSYLAYCQNVPRWIPKRK